VAPVPVDADLAPSTNRATANIHDDWTFELGGINGPRRLQLVRAPAGWSLEAVRVNGIDVTDRPLAFGLANQSVTDVEVVLTDRVTTVTGTITDDRRRPAPGARLIIVSTDHDRWYPGSRFMWTAVAGSDGTATLVGLPAGTYYAAAIVRIPVQGDDAWQDPILLDGLVPRASTLTLTEGCRWRIPNPRHERRSN